MFVEWYILIDYIIYNFHFHILKSLYTNIFIFIYFLGKKALDLIMLKMTGLGDKYWEARQNPVGKWKLDIELTEFGKWFDSED